MLSICILAVGLTLAHCQVVENAGADDFMRHIRNPRHTTIIYKDSMEVGSGRCSKSAMRTIFQMHTASVCQPLPVVLTIDIIGAAENYLPENVKVERCGGECKHQNCIPSQIEIVRVPVYFLQSRSCGTVEVEEHKECKCGCLPKQCGPMHVFDERRCDCACIDQMAEKLCLPKFHSYWDKPTCACRCRNVETCSTGEYFDHDECRCVPDMEVLSRINRLG